MSYGRFRRFAILLPQERLTVMDPGLAWFEAATVMPLGALPAKLFPKFDAMLRSRHLNRKPGGGGGADPGLAWLEAAAIMPLGADPPPGKL